MKSSKSNFDLISITDAILSANGFTASSGIVWKSFKEIVPVFNLSSWLNRLCSLEISLGVNVVSNALENMDIMEKGQIFPLISMSPKRQDKVVPFKLPMIMEEELTQSLTMFGLLFGVFGVLWKNKYSSWAGLAFNIVGSLNQRAGVQDARSGITLMSFSVLQLIMLYSQMFTAPSDASILEFGK